ncbi:MAG: amidohydrolase [Acidobacteriota bacterium]|nr:amidohydrolase [Blastocatellia bacterium]MDW8413480.1 amidohydrolase [Acidobacteriota bacterium]
MMTLLLLLLPLMGQIEADIIFTNCVVYTVNPRQPRAEAVATKGDRIVYVGSAEGASLLKGPKTKVIDLKGKAVYPGFTDSHCHLRGIGERELSLNLEGTKSLREMLERVKEHSADVGKGEWVIGRGWIETFWSPPVFPTSRDLDSVVSDKPVVLYRADGHAAVVNTVALKLSGISRDTPDPFGGKILRNDSGLPTGVLLDRAQELVTKHIPAPTLHQLEKAIITGAERSLRLGWTELQDAGGTLSEAELIHSLCKQGKLRIRIYKAVHGPSEDAYKLIRQGAKIGVCGNRFTLRSIKVLLDGALGSRGAAMMEPYLDEATSGFLTVKEEELFPMLLEALRFGIQVQTHAIGDLANRRILDLYERAFAAVPPNERLVPEPRWRVEHAQILSPADIGRFAKLGVIASMQPSHAISDLHFAPRRIGLQRLAGAYAWQSLLKSGAIIAAGSDAPVEAGDPLIEFYAAVVRRDMQGYAGDGWHLEQALTREQALKMLTIWPAQAAMEEHLRGSIEVDKLADLTILSADIMTIPEGEILKTRCFMTVVGGEIVYENR